MRLNTWIIYPDVSHPIRQTCCIQEYVNRASKYDRHIVMVPCEEVHVIQGNCLLLNKPVNLHIHQRHSKLTLLHDAPIYVIATDIDIFHITKSTELIPGKWSTDSQRRLISFERF